MAWLGSPFKAEQVNGRVEGFGDYKFPDGTIYSGEFKDGQFHGQGALLYPNGGKYEGTFKDGRMIQGRFSFQDGLQYTSEKWDYCSPEGDRRFYTERINGVSANHLTEANKEFRLAFTEKLVNGDQAPRIPKHTFDVGDGYYDPKDKHVYAYPDQKVTTTNFSNSSPVILRVPEPLEVEWITNNCRVEI